MKQREPKHNIEDTDFYFGLAILCAAMGSFKCAALCMACFALILTVDYIRNH